jgi:ABC-type microcin C transport system permease subunit YejE
VTDAEDPSYGQIVWAQLKKRRLAYASLWGVVALVVMAIGAPAVISNKPLLWRVGAGPWQSPWIVSLFDRNFYESALDVVFNSLLLPGSGVAAMVWCVWLRTRCRPRKSRSRARRRALVVGVSVWAVCCAGLFLAPYSTAKVVYPELQQRLQESGEEVTALYPVVPYSFRDVDLLGTDNAGRDVFARLVYGTRISLTVGLFAVFLYVTFGTIVGALAGYYGGWVDLVTLRAVEVMMSIPSLFLVLTLAAFIEERVGPRRPAWCGRSFCGCAAWTS